MHILQLLHESTGFTEGLLMNINLIERLLKNIESRDELFYPVKASLLDDVQRMSRTPGISRIDN